MHAMRLPAILVSIGIGVAACGGDVKVQTRPEGQISGTVDHCVVSVRYTGTEPVESALVGIDYSNVAGNFGEPGPTISCHAVSHGVKSAIFANFCRSDCRDKEPRNLQLSFYTGQAGDDDVIVGPADLARCDFQGDGSTLDRLSLTIVDTVFEDENLAGYGGSFELATECGEPTTTSTTLTTTTTLCGDADCSAARSFELELEDDVEIGALQIEVTYPCTAGRFDVIETVPLGNVIRCELGDLNVDLWATNDQNMWRDDTAGCRRIVRFGLISLSGINGPGTLLRCPFHPEDPDLDAGVFDLSVTDATTVDGDELSVAVSLNLSE